VGLGPPAQPSPPGWLTLTGLGLGRSNRPSPAPLPHPALPCTLAPVQPESPRRRPAIPAASGGLCRRHHGRNAPLCALLLLHRTDSAVASSARRFVAGSHSGNRLSAVAELTPRRISTLGVLCMLAVVQVCVLRRWCGAPGGAR
jgi:hypothetical protein